MGHLGDGTQITTVQDNEIVLTSVDGQYFRMKVTDLAEAIRQVMPVATSKVKGLLDRSKYILYDSYTTRAIVYNAIKIVTDIGTSNFKAVLLDLKILSYNYNGLISFLLKGNISEGKVSGAYLSNGNFSGVESIYVYNENGKVCFTVNFIGSGLNISNGVIIANCCVVHQGIMYDYSNSIVNISDSAKYVKGTNSNEIENIVPSI